MRMIDADKATELLTKLLYETALNNSGEASMMCEDIAEHRLKTWIDLIPTESDPIKHGEWLMDDESGDIKCSCCGHWSYDTYDEPFVIDGYKGIATVMPHYCGYCGAKMD